MLQSLGEINVSVKHVEPVEFHPVLALPGAPGKHRRRQIREVRLEDGEVRVVPVDVGLEAGHATFELAALGSVSAAANRAEVL